MSNIKTIVKVMNFQALIHVDSAHKAADKYLALEKDVSHMIGVIENNRNLSLDNKALKVDEKAPRLRIYVGSDLGFCGVVNSAVNQELLKEKGKNTLIIIGKKIHTKHKVALRLSRDELENNYDKIEKIFEDGVKNKLYSGIDIFYNHYYNMSHISPIMKTIYPIAIEKTDDESLYRDDFMIEGGDVSQILQSLTVTYLNYEMRSAIVNSYASENILRQQATNESLKHIDEMEAAKRWEERKKKNAQSVSRIIDSFVKTKYRAE